MGVGLSAGLFLPSILTSCKKDDPGPEVQYDGTIAIIGAGAAGLYAADIMRTKGLNVVVFEAGSQMGGRIRSLRNQKEFAFQSIADFPAELGAEIIYGSDGAWNKIIRNFNLPTVELTGGDRYVIDNTVKDAAGWQGDGDFTAAQNFIRTISNYNGAAASVRQAGNAVGNRGQGLINAQLGNRYGTSSERLGARPLAESLKLLQRDSRVFSISTNPMQDVLLSRFNSVAATANLATPITAINYSGEKIMLTVKNGAPVEVDKVVVTVPVAVLKKGSISFSPSLPQDKVSAMSRLGMDACIRVVLDFKKNFWGETSEFIWGSSIAPQLFNAGFGRSDFYQTLSVTICGSAAEQLSGLTDGQIIDAVLAEIDRLYAGQGTGFVRRELDSSKIIGFVKNWTADEYIQGGFSYALAGGSIQDRKTLSAPIGNKVFFAGEATDILGDAGSINGALNSAERVVEEVVKSITG